MATLTTQEPSVLVRGRMPALVYKEYLRENPIDGSLYYTHVVVMLSKAWERSPESRDPSWDVIRLKFFVVAHRNLF